MLKELIPLDWQLILHDEFTKSYFMKLEKFLSETYEHHTIFPEKSHIFHALKLTPFKDVKVVLLGQDPYHGENQAHGLSFSVPDDIDLPPSLKNIYKELYNDTGITRTTGNLENWAKQGVLLLNDVLTVEKGLTRSHRNKGWELFTEAIFKAFNQIDHPIIFVLWGNDAKKKIPLIHEKHLILTAPHPSPLSVYRGFYGSKPFSKINAFLTQNNLNEIKWT